MAGTPVRHVAARTHRPLKPLVRAAVVRLVFGEGLTYVEAAAKLHVTKGVIAGHCRQHKAEQARLRQLADEREPETDRRLGLRRFSWEQAAA